MHIHPTICIAKEEKMF